MSIINNKPVRLLTYSQIKQNSPDYRSIHRTNEIYQKILNKFSEHLSSEPLTNEKFNNIKDEFFEFMILLDQNMSRGRKEIEIPDNFLNSFSKFEDLLTDIQFILTHKNTYNTCFSTEDTKINLGFGFFKYGTKKQFSYSEVNYTTRAENLIKFISELSLDDIKEKITLFKISGEPEPITIHNQISSIKKNLLIEEHNKKVYELQELKENLSHYQDNLQFILCALEAPVVPKKYLKKLFPKVYKKSNSDNIILNKNEQLALKNIIKAKEENIQSLIKNIIELQENIKSLRIGINTPENTISETLDTLSSNQIGEDYSINLTNLFIQPCFNFVISAAHSATCASSYIKNTLFGMVQATGLISTQSSSENVKPEKHLLEKVVQNTITTLQQATDGVAIAQPQDNMRQNNSTTISLGNVDEVLNNQVVNNPEIIPTDIFVISTKESRIKNREKFLLKLNEMYKNLEIESNKISDEKNKKIFLMSIYYFKTLMNALNFLNSKSFLAVKAMAILGTSAGYCSSKEYLASIEKLITGDTEEIVGSEKKTIKVKCFKTNEELKLRKLILSNMHEIMRLLTDNNSEFHLVNLFNIDDDSTKQFPKLLESIFDSLNYVEFENNVIFNYISMKTNFNKIKFNLYRTIYSNRNKLDLIEIIDQSRKDLDEPLKYSFRYLIIDLLFKTLSNKNLYENNKKVINIKLIDFLKLRENYASNPKKYNFSALMEEINKIDELSLNENEITSKIADEIMNFCFNEDFLLLKELKKIIPQLVIDKYQFKEDLSILLQDSSLIIMILELCKYNKDFSTLTQKLNLEQISLEKNYFQGKIFKDFFEHFANIAQKSYYYREIKKLAQIEG